jgi:hypothetical protein
MDGRPRLKHTGWFGLRAEIDFAEQVLQLSLRRRAVIEVDDSRGVRSWQLVYKVLPGTLDGPITLDSGDIQSRADYLWDFFCERKGGEGPQSFIITCPRDGKDYLAVFTETKLSYEMFNVRLFTTGLGIIQVDEDDVNTLEDGSLGDTSDNNAEI